MSDTKSYWEKIYTDKAPSEVSWYQAEPTCSLRLIRNTGLSTDEPIIDVGGGASVLVDRLLAAGFTHPAVLDISSRALTFARERLGAAAEGVEWYEADVTRFNPPHLFSLWHDRAVLHFLTDPQDRERYVHVLNKSLRSGGHLILAAFAVCGPTRCSGRDIVQYDAEKLMSELGSAFTLVEQIDETHLTPAHKEQRFSYFRCLRP